MVIEADYGGDGADHSGSGGIGSVVYFGGSAGEDAGVVGAVDIDSTAIGGAS